MQISLNPKKKNSEFDAYSTISFFPDRFSNATCGNFKNATSSDRAPFVVPLLVAEDLESGSYNRTNEKVIQLGLALMASINGIGGKAGFSSTAKDFMKTTGNDYNSLMTVGRISDNSIRVRFGAMQTASEDGKKKEYVMVPRTHFVTLLLMVPKENKSELTAVTRTTLLDIDNGKETIITVTGGKNLNSKTISPALLATFNGKRVKLPPLAVKAIAGGTGSLISFQSLKDIKNLKTNTLKISFDETEHRNTLLYQEKAIPADQPAECSVQSSMKNIITEKGKGKLQVVFSKVNSGGSISYMRVLNGAVKDSYLNQAGFILSDKISGWRGCCNKQSFILTSDFSYR